MTFRESFGLEPLARGVAFVDRRLQASSTFLAGFIAGAPMPNRSERAY